jgi:L,D-peptidoglycan transpeptidase YkuD (ErfK/YbiS/YcfS/YnhG family)
MDMIVSADGHLVWRNITYRCALGAGGVTDAKREGDKATPTGCFALRRLLFRADRLARPQTGLGAVSALDPADGWCDAPDDANYNRLVRHPYGASAERLWRDDGLYDVIVVLGHNDDPVVAGAGSAVFLHVARPDYGPTEGCVALALDDLLAVLRDCDDATRLCVSAGPGT